MRNLYLDLICVLIFGIATTGETAIVPTLKAIYHDLTKHFHDSSFLHHKVHGKYRDCSELRSVNNGMPGLYNISFNGTFVPVRCYYNGTNAYTIIQQRLSGNVDFNRKLAEYAAGFGSATGDFWLGLNIIRRLVELGNTKLQIVMTSWPPSQQTIVANYGYFSIGTQAQGWALSVGNYNGPVADDLSYSNGKVFYTSDVPDPNLCAVHQRGGWWYNYCSYAFLNGYYYRNGKYVPPGQFYDGIYWKDWLGYDYSLMQVTMAVSP
ncbi:angiopoietin-related protein 2-like [Paramacrobiotus metropolitanus]|uniref:angiopoietin-related protein 2-like n=1 Tax=Paramacrobiotus metropolitanus TaxID=2943436 RepID=UPI002445EBD6|nr:angiopoietin-related protein 2-like [Paramacrobiotus metropolitanus]